ncbi:germination protein YpeB [Paenibacillus urinalis]|uniref:Germination protein YpeB n=1 Tax=Paenibacillus urinalis TaxID=521520 RepID=A0AAX3MVG3_9BACL|nr:germination protein YpeB [Paenibacillus urinalis]WDH81257.1 germination protein YpeB [Paenibacillus urinalis]
MYRRISSVLFPIMTVLLIGAIIWGYQLNQQKNSVMVQSENQYQRAFHDLSYNMDRIHSELGNTLAVSSASEGMHRKGLMNVWRLSSEAQNEIAQLPIRTLPFTDTEELLSRISKFAYQASIRDLTKNPLTDEEKKNLQTLYKNTEQINKDLDNVQMSVLNDHLKWSDAEMAMTSDKEVKNGIVDGFRSVNKKVGEYPPLEWGPSVSSLYEQRKVRKLNGVPVTTADVKRKAQKFADLNQEEIQVTENGKGTNYRSYTASAVHQDGHKVSMDFTADGGLLISYNDEREVGPKKVDRETAMNKADQFLEKKGYREMEAVAYNEYDNLGNFTYVRQHEDVLVYPEKITVRVALDNGEVIGLQTTEFLNEHQEDREFPLPKMKMKDAKAKLNPDFKVSMVRKALIKNEFSDEVLCYQFVGKINGSQYRIYLNSDTGIEEAVEVVPGQTGRL